MFLLFSIARRPIGPGRRSHRYKYNQREPMASDEENTSEYSHEPSSQSSTLESNPGVVRAFNSMQNKRPNITSDGSSDSDSDEISDTTIATQLCVQQDTAETTV